MKKIYVFVTLFFLILSLVIPVSANTAEAPLIVDLVAGQNEHAGDIKAWDDGISLYILYETITPWCLTETHLSVASSVEDIPQTHGNPIPGQFRYKNTHNCATSFIYKIPLINNSCMLYIASHAVVSKPGAIETAWGSGLNFQGKNWGTYFTYESTACKITPTPTNSLIASSTNTATTATATSTFTPTATGIPTSTNTPTSTFTSSPTATATSTFTPTVTGTLPTNTPTNTFTSTATNTLTNTPTATATTTCQPTLVTADFSKVAVGQSVEGMGTVAPGLNIDAKGTAVKILPIVDPTIYLASVNGVNTVNGHMVSGGGFSDLATRNAGQAHLYTFTFAPGTSVANFSLHMLDFGDLNPTLSTNHYVAMTAYNTNGVVVSKQELSYITSADLLPLSLNGDASAPAGQPGNWTWNVSGTGIVKIVLEFGAGFDPNVALDLLSFTIECP